MQEKNVVTQYFFNKSANMSQNRTIKRKKIVDEILYEANKSRNYLAELTGDSEAAISNNFRKDDLSEKVFNKYLDALNKAGLTKVKDSHDVNIHSLNQSGESMNNAGVTGGTVTENNHYSKGDCQALLKAIEILERNNEMLYEQLKYYRETMMERTEIILNKFENMEK